MPKLGLVLMSSMLVSFEVGSSRSISATQLYPHQSGLLFHRPIPMRLEKGFATERLHSIALAKKCTLKRYRRPH